MKRNDNSDIIFPQTIKSIRVKRKRNKGVFSLLYFPLQVFTIKDSWEDYLIYGNMISNYSKYMIEMQIWLKESGLQLLLKLGQVAFTITLLPV